MIFTNTYFVDGLSKAASENISFQQAKSKNIDKNVGNFEH